MLRGGHHLTPIQGPQISLVSEAIHRASCVEEGMLGMHDLAEASVLLCCARGVVKAETSLPFHSQQLHVTVCMLPFHGAMIETELNCA